MGKIFKDKLSFEKADRGVGVNVFYQMYEKEQKIHIANILLSDSMGQYFFSVEKEMSYYCFPEEKIIEIFEKLKKLNSSIQRDEFGEIIY